MPEQEPQVRAKNFDEVPFGYNPELAKIEASRCLQCKKPACVQGCPVSIDIPSFIGMILQEDFIGAARKLKEMNSLPAVCGRVCPQEDQCEKVCILGKKGGARGDRPPGAVCSRFRPRPWENCHALHGCVHGKKSGGRGFGPGRLTLGRGPESRTGIR